MVAIVAGAAKTCFAAELDHMHRDRKRVFVDWLRWNVPVVGGTHEIDQFDNDDAVYLIESTIRRRHLASIRLLPTTGPHLMSEVFACLCEGGVPRGPHIWELTRFCVSPDASKPDAHRLRDLMWTASVEYAVRCGITHYTCVTHVQFLSQILAAGWETEPLGLPQTIDGIQVGAVLFRITAETLKESQARYGYHGSIFESEAATRAA
jgi:N-acyl-L-homoserine lactone synthetase